MNYGEGCGEVPIRTAQSLMDNGPEIEQPGVAQHAPIRTALYMDHRWLQLRIQTYVKKSLRDKKSHFDPKITLQNLKKN